MGKAVDPALVKRFKKEQILDLAKRSLTSVVAHFALYVFIAIGTPLKTDHPMELTGFGVVIFVVSALRMILAKKIPFLYDQNPEKWNGILIGFNYLSGMIWGVFSLMMGIYYPLEWPFLFTLVINCGLAAGATSSLGPHQTLSRNFTLCMMLPVTIWGFVNGTDLGIFTGVLCTFSMFMFIRMSKDNYLWYWESMASTEKINSHTVTMERIFKGVHNNAAALNLTSKNLSNSSNDMIQNAGLMSQRLSQVSQIAEKVNTNSRTMVNLMDQTTDNFSNIASATEEMTATITDISTSAETTCEITTNAVSQSEAAVAQMAVLADSATAINKITEAIGDISEQINLLALNATIEAARAGEAGKGFAVVATEIKELAVQTSGSASEISRQVKEIQEATQKTASEMDIITGIVREANTRVEGIAVAVDEQSVATTEVSRNIQEASQGLNTANEMTGENGDSLEKVTLDISQLEDQAKTVETGASAVDTNAETLRNLAREMVNLVDSEPTMVQGGNTVERPMSEGVSSVPRSSEVAFSTP